MAPANSEVVRVGTAVTADGAELYFRAEGEGTTALVASNGIGVSTFFWEKLARHFAPTHTVITWDYRGHGKSPVPRDAEHVTVTLCARDLWTVIERAGFDKAVLLGHSMGAQVILEAYRQRPESVQALVPLLGAAGDVFSSFIGGGRVKPLLRLFIEAGARAPRVAERLLRSVLGLPGVFEAVRALGIVHPDLCPREAFEPYLEHLRQLDLRAWFALARDLLSHDATDLLPHVSAPTLVVAGERDLFTPLRRSREMAARIPGAQLLVLREGSHAAMVEQPELLALSLEKFLRSYALA